MGTTATVTTGAGAYGGATAGTILLNMWLKRHGYEQLEPDQAMAVVAVAGPPLHTALLIVSAVVKALLRKVGVTVLDDLPAAPISPTPTPLPPQS